MPEVKTETEEDRIRTQFRDRYGALRMRNIILAKEQRELRLQQKPSKGRIRKSRAKANEITVILNIMLQMRGKDTVRSVQMFCRDRLCNQHRDKLIGEKRVFLHAYPEDDYESARCLRLRKEIVKELELDKFLV